MTGGGVDISFFILTYQQISSPFLFNLTSQQIYYDGMVFTMEYTKRKHTIKELVWRAEKKKQG